MLWVKKGLSMLINGTRRMIAGLSTGRQRLTSLSGLYTLHIGLLAMCNSSPGYLYPDQTIKNLWVFPCLAIDCKKKRGGDLLNPCEVEVSLGQTKAGLLFPHVAPMCPYALLGTRPPPSGCYLRDRFQRLSQKWPRRKMKFRPA